MCPSKGVTEVLGQTFQPHLGFLPMFARWRTDDSPVNREALRHRAEKGKDWRAPRE